MYYVREISCLAVNRVLSPPSRLYLHTFHRHREQSIIATCSNEVSSYPGHKLMPLRALHYFPFNRSVYFETWNCSFSCFCNVSAAVLPWWVRLLFQSFWQCVRFIFFVFAINVSVSSSRVGWQMLQTSFPWLHLSLDLQTFATTNHVNLYLFFNLRKLFSLQQEIITFLSLILYDYYTYSN
jgi:hypothetical protein